jgi:type VI protein secretion system component VasK
MSCFKGVNYLVINADFNALIDIFLKNSYSSDAIFNIDKTSFTLSTTLLLKVLIKRRDTRVFKKRSRRQEWIIVIKYIRALGIALLLLLIFKAKYINTA